MKRGGPRRAHSLAAAAAGSPAARAPTRAAALAIAASVAACVTARGIVEERGTGEARCYRAPYDTIWGSAQEALTTLGLVLERANREEGVFVARTYRPEVRDPEEMALEADQGERVALFVDRDGPDVWVVEVISRPIFELDVTARNWTRDVFLALERVLPESAMDPHEDLAACVRIRTTPRERHAAGRASVRPSHASARGA